MPRIQVPTLTGADLDRAVILALGYTIDADNCAVKDGVAEFNIDCFNPSEVWAQGDPIIKREQIEIRKGNPLYFPQGNEHGESYEPLWLAGKQHGTTPLVAAMRCYVASVFGDTVDLD